jgi:LMBR1 domain-containing protein 1
MMPLYRLVLVEGDGLDGNESLWARNYVPPVMTNMTINVSLPIYITALISFTGWFAFSVFVGIGLVALPLDLILAFFFRPKFIPADVYAQQKMLIQIRALELMEVGKSLKASRLTVADSKMSTRARQKHAKVDTITMNKFKANVYLLEKDVQELKLCHEDFKSYNPLVPLGKMILGFICSILSLLWILQIIVAMLPPFPILPFLNDYFIWFDAWFPLFGTVSVGLFTMYLLACSIKGCFKFGMRCFCCAVLSVAYTYI